MDVDLTVPMWERSPNASISAGHGQVNRECTPKEKLCAANRLFGRLRRLRLAIAGPSAKKPTTLSKGSPVHVTLAALGAGSLAS